MRYWLCLGVLLGGMGGAYAQEVNTFAAEYDFYAYLLREAHAEEAYAVLQQLEARPQLSAPQQDTVYWALGRYHYNRQELVLSAQAYGQVSPHQRPLWREAVFFQSLALAYEQQPLAARQVLAEAHFQDSLYRELAAFQQAGLSLLARDFEAYQQHRQAFTGRYFALAEQEQALGQWASDLQGYTPKKPWLAATLSALVPGLGRVYAGKWGQGVATFMQVGVLGLLAWEGYRLGGPTDWRFIAGATAGSVFYVTNVVGSAYAARQRNDEFYEAVDYRLVVDMHVPLRTLFR